MTNNNDQLKKISEIGFIPSQGLGDGLLQLVFAQNLSKQGFTTTVYHNHLYSLAPIISQVQLKSCDVDETMLSSLTQHKVVLFDQGSQFSKNVLAELSELPVQFIAYVVSRSKLKHVISSNLSQYLADQDAINLTVFSGFNGNLRHPTKHNLTINQHFQWKMEQVLGIKEFDLKPALDIPNEWNKALNTKRVLIHPTSSSTDKNWSTESFLSLVHRLEEMGWEPKFTVSPSEWNEWNNMLNGKRLAPSFGSILNLAKYYYESAAFIGNDSGNGHLASAMDLPVLSIYNRKKLFYPWKPSWSPNAIVAPWLPKSVVKDKWSRFLSVDKVLKEFDRLVSSS